MTAQKMDIIDNLQRTSYQVLEDMRQLNQHREVRKHTQSDERASRFVELVNRKTFVFPGDPIDLEKKYGRKEAGEIVRFPFAKPMEETLVVKPMEETLDELLEAFAQNSPDGDPFLPPPLWLRLLKFCVDLLNHEEKNKHKDDNWVCRWLAFNVDWPAHLRPQRTDVIVNINSAGKIKWASEKLNPLTNILFELPYPCTFWGIRFRSGEPNSDERKFLPWMDIGVESDDTDMNSLGSDKEISVSYAPPRLGAGFDFDESLLQGIFEQWADVTASNGGKSQSVYQYCRQLREFYPQGVWPQAGIDCLLCPGIFWSPSEEGQGASATIYWGFEGEIQDRMALRLLRTSQFLLSGIGQYARVIDIRDDATELGELAMLQTLGHEMKKISGAITDRWIPHVDDLFQVRYSPAANGLWPNKLGQIELAKEAKDILPQLGLAPFRNTLLTAGKVIELWCGTVDSEDKSAVGLLGNEDSQFPKQSPVEAQIAWNWNVAIDVIVFFGLARKFANTVERVCELNEYFRDIRAIFPTCPQISYLAKRTFPAHEPTAAGDQRATWLSRLYLALLTNCLQHGDPALPTDVVLKDGASVDENNRKFDFCLRVTNTSRRENESDIAAALCDRVPLSATRIVECVAVFCRGMTIGQTIRSASSTRKVVESCIDKLGHGKVTEWTGSVRPGVPFAVSIEFTLSEPSQVK